MRVFKMKYWGFSIFLLVLIGSCKERCPCKSRPIHLQNLRLDISPLYSFDSPNTIVVSCELVNTGKESIYFLDLMQRFMKFDTLKFKDNDWRPIPNINRTLVVALHPGQVYKFNYELIAKTKDHEIRLGFMLLEAEDDFNEFQIKYQCCEFKTENTEIVWSNLATPPAQGYKMRSGSNVRYFKEIK